MSDEFVYGKNEVANCECPVLSAGFSMETNPYAIRAARAFDNVAHRNVDDFVGIVSEDTAKEWWLDTIAYLDQKNDSEARETARQIAEELGWL